MKTILLLLLSNTFMTAAWYWHLKHKEIPIWKVLLISWGLVFFELGGISEVKGKRVGTRFPFSINAPGSQSL